MPVYALEFVTLGQEDSPKNVENALLLPAHEGAVDGRFVAKLCWQVVPLAARPQAVDDAVEGAASIGAWTAHVVGRIVHGQDFLDQCPKWVGGVPDRRQRFLLGCGFFGWFSYWRRHARIIGVWLLLLELRLLQ